MRVCESARSRAYVCVCLFLCMCACVCARLCVCVCLCECVCAYSVGAAHLGFRLQASPAPPVPDCLQRWGSRSTSEAEVCRSDKRPRASGGAEEERAATDIPKPHDGHAFRVGPNPATCTKQAASEEV